MLTHRKSNFSIYFGIALIGFGLPALARAGDASESTYLQEIDLLQPKYLAQDRMVCAMGKMPAIKQKMDADKRLRLNTPLPDTDAYCLKIVTVSRAKHRLMDLYINIALQEQGYSSFHFAEQATLLKNNEVGRTLEVALRAANAGQTSYTSITGTSRDLPCPLALDAGATWADGNDKATLPIALTEAEASAIARQCYAPATTTITVRGIVMPAQKAGLIAGIWLAKH